MRINESKTTTAVLIHIPRPLYNRYLGVLLQKNLRTQAHNAQVFIQAISAEIEEFEKFRERSDIDDSNYV